MENIRSYNDALAFASMSAKFVPKMDKPSPYFFKITGQMYHNVSNSIRADKKDTPSYSQLYILDSSTATELRMQNSNNSNCKKEVIIIICINKKFLF